MSSSSSPSSPALPVVEGAAAEVLEEIVQLRVDERVAEAVQVAQGQLREEVKDEVDIAILDNASTEHAKVEIARRRIMDLERRLLEAERGAAHAIEAETRAQQAERGRREANARASALEADLNAMRMRAMQQSNASAPQTVISSRRFAAPVMTPISTRRDENKSTPVPTITDVQAQAQAHREAMEAELRRLAAERDHSAAQIAALQQALHNERERAQVLTQMQSQYGIAAAAASGRQPTPDNNNKVPHAPVYNGLSGPTERGFYDWKPAVEIYFRVKKWSTITDAAKCIDYASARLDKDAARWYVDEYLPVAPEGVDASWEHFTTALADKFEHSSESVAARVKLQQLQQRSLSVAEYNAEFNRLSSRIKDMSAMDKQLIYQNGLRYSIREKLLGHVDSVDDAMRMALKVEQAFSFAHSNSSATYRPHKRPLWQPRTPMPTAASSSQSTGGSGNSSSTPMELGSVEASRRDRSSAREEADDDVDEELAAMQPSSRGLARRPLTAEQQRLYKENRCFGCQQRGHIRRDCPQAARQSKNE